MNRDGDRLGDAVSVELAGGLYEITLTSSDELHKPDFQPAQMEEQWFLEALDGDGKVVASTSPIDDLAEGANELIQSVGSYDLQGVVAVRARHLGVGGINSVVPTAARFSAADCEDPGDNIEPIQGSEKDVPESIKGPIAEAPLTTDVPTGAETAPGGMVEFVRPDTLPGVRVVIESAGGITEGTISVRPIRELTVGMKDIAASPVYDISVPNPDSVLSASITLPYSERTLGAIAEGDLALATFDEETNFWVPVSGSTQVDVVNNTVTAQVDHLSLYTVVKGAVAGSPF